MFKLIPAVALAVALHATSLFAQYREKIVFFDGKPECRTNFKIDSGAARPECNTIDDKDGTIRVIKFNSLKLSIQVVPVLSVRVKLENQGQDKVLVERDTWSIAHYRTESGMLSGETPLTNERAYNYVKFRLEQPHTRAVPAVSMGSEPGYVRPNGSTLPEARQQLILKPGQSSTLPAGRTTEYRRVKGVPGKTEHFSLAPIPEQLIDPNKEVSGVIYFRRPPESKAGMIFIHVKNVTFVFPTVFVP